MSLLLSILFALIAYSNGQISVGCPEPSTLYEELGCIPSFRNPNSQCAFAYDCDSVFNRDKSHCFFQGDTYMVNEPISSNKLGRSCFRDCGCERGTDGGIIKCSGVNCGIVGIPPNCSVIAYRDPSSCCPYCKNSTGFMRCTVNNIRFVEGERVSPDKCVTCQCTRAGVDCWKNSCLQEIFNMKYIDMKCAPVYGTDECCPNTWICPSSNEIQIRKVNYQSNYKCKFGSKSYNIGDMLAIVKSMSSIYILECVIPPFMTVSTYSV